MQSKEELKEIVRAILDSSSNDTVATEQIIKQISKREKKLKKKHKKTIDLANKAIQDLQNEINKYKDELEHLSPQKEKTPFLQPAVSKATEDFVSNLKQKISNPLSGKENVLQEANRITSQDRQEDYDSPLKNFTRTAKGWSAILGIEITPEQVGLCQISLKMSREAHKHKRDNLVDIAGYARTIEKVHDEREQLNG